MVLRRHLTSVQARLVQLMQKLSPDHFDWATSIVLGRYPGAVQVRTVHMLCLTPSCCSSFVCCKELLQAHACLSL